MRWRGTAGGARLPHRRLVDTRLHIKHEQRRAGADKEQSTPADVGKQEAKSGRRQNRSEGVALLQDAGESPAPFFGQCFKGQCRTDAPLAAHRDAKERAQNQQHVHRGREGAGQFNDRKTEDVGDQNRAAPVPVGEHAEDQRADRPESLRQKHGAEHVGRLGMEICCNRLDAKDQKKKVEAVECPAQEGSEEGVSLAAAQLLEVAEK